MRERRKSFAPGGAFYIPYPGNELGLTINTDQDGQDNSTVRITWTEKDPNHDIPALRNYFLARAGVVQYDDGQPDRIYPPQDLSDDVEANVDYPDIVVNDSDYRDNVAFSQYGYDYQSEKTLARRGLSSVGTWQSPVTVSQYGLEFKDSSMTYRYFGVPRQIWIHGGGTLRTEHDIIVPAEHPYYSMEYSKACTNKTNRTDIFTAYSEIGEENLCIIRQLEP